MQSALTIIGGIWRRLVANIWGVAARLRMYLAITVAVLRWRRDFVVEKHQGSQTPSPARDG